MTATPTKKNTAASTRSAADGQRPAHCRRVALVLQGGGALGAYQAGVYSVLAEAGYQPDWLAGVSIGAINAALIAGNPPGQRVEKLRAFWERISTAGNFEPLLPGTLSRSLFNRLSAFYTVAAGVDGFFRPRVPPPWLFPDGAAAASSFYDTAPLRETLEALIDFDLLNSGEVRLSIGAVNVRSGNSVYFDNLNQRIGPEHIMASGALPPGFPAIVIDGEAYWDGGVVSNTPLQYVLDDRPQHDRLIFQVDLFSARGDVPGNLLDVSQRQKDILYSSRTRLNTDASREIQNLRRAVRRLIDKLPQQLRSDPDVELIDKLSSDASLSIVHLIYRTKNYEVHSKDYEFSQLSMREHWHAGAHDTQRTLRSPEWLQAPAHHIGVRTFDLA